MAGGWNGGTGPGGAGAERGYDQMTLLWVLNLADGRHNLLDMAERAGQPFAAIRAAVDAAITAGLLVPATDSDTDGIPGTDAECAALHSREALAGPPTPAAHRPGDIAARDDRDTMVGRSAAVPTPEAGLPQ